MNCESKCCPTLVLVCCLLQIFYASTRTPTTRTQNQHNNHKFAMIFLLISSVREIYSQFTVAQRHFSRTHASSGLVSTRTNIRLLASNLEFPLNAKEEVKYCDCLHMIIILRLKLHFLSLHFLRTERTAHTHTWIWLKFRLRGNATRLHKLHFSDMFCKSDFDQCGGEPAQWPV